MRPPGNSTFCLDRASAIVFMDKLYAFKRSGSISTCTSRFCPPMMEIAPTPEIDSKGSLTFFSAISVSSLSP
jgi:hypothetical protein